MNFSIEIKKNYKNVSIILNQSMKAYILILLFFLSSFSVQADSMFSGFFDKSITESALWKTLKDPTLREKAIVEIKKDIQKYVDIIIKLYNKGLDKEDREMLIDLISYSKNQSGEKFLKDVVSNKASEDRTFSLKKYMQDYKVDANFVS
jgi:Na+/phosphate symporter